MAAERTAEATSTQLPQGAAFHIGRVYPNGYEADTRMGDLREHHHRTRVEVMNRGFDNTLPDIDKVLAHGPQIDTHESLLEAGQRATKLRSHLEQYSKDNTFPSSVSLDMAKRQQEADSQTEGMSLEVRTAARFAKFDGVQVASDHDGTWSDLSGKIQLGHTGVGYFPEENYLTDLIPISEHAEALLFKYGRDHFPEIHAMTWAPYLQEGTTGRFMFEQAGLHVPLRPGAKGLMDYFGEEDMKVTFVSQNFVPVLEGVVKQIGSETPVEIRAIDHDNADTLDKSAVLHEMAKANPDMAIVFLGDGETDYRIELAYRMGIINAVFALEGEGFDKTLTEHNIPHFTFRDLNDIRVKLEEVTTLAKQIKAGNAIASV